MIVGKPVVVARFSYRHEGELALGFLKNAGIQAALFVDDAGGMEIGMAFSNPARIMVPSAQYDEACEILESLGIEVEPLPES